MPQRKNDFSGRADAVVQAGTVHGDVHVHGARPPFAPPHQLPLSPSNFVNREDELRQLDALFASQQREPSTHGGSVIVSAVAGAPGVGKTALAVHWGHRVRSQFPDGDLYVDMQGYGPGIAVTPDRALDSFLRALETPPERIPEDVEGRSALFRSILADKRVLVIIDNVASSQQVRRLLPASPHCFAVVTSRSTLSGVVAREGAVRVTLDVLSPEEAVELLAALMGRTRVEAEPAAARNIADLCGHLPLALRIVAERGAGRPRLSLHELVEELIGEQNRLDALATAEDELSDMRAVFSWSYTALSSELRRTFRLLGLHPGPETGVEPIAALIGVDKVTARRRLRALADAHLLHEVSVNRFRLHDLLRAYAIERVTAEETPRDRTLAIRRMLSWYLLAADAGRKAILPHSPSVPLVPPDGIEVPDAFRGGPDAMRWFSTERDNILAVLNLAMELGQYDVAWKLPVVTSGFFELSSYWSDREQSHQAGLSSATALGDRFGEACNLVMLGDAERRLGGYSGPFSPGAARGCRS